MTLPYAILEFFLHNLKKSIMHLERTEAFSVARRGPGRFLLEKDNHLPFPFSFPTSLPSLFGFQTPLSVHLFPLEPHKLLSHLHTMPHCSLLLLAGGVSMMGRQENQASSPLLSCLSAWSTAQPPLPWREPVQVFLKGNAYRAELVTTTLSNI